MRSNSSLETDPQLQEAASPQVLRSGQLQRGGQRPAPFNLPLMSNVGPQEVES
jgi:hypothetical protein